MRGQPATPARRSAAEPSPQAPAATVQRSARGRAVQPASQEATHRPTHTAARASDAGNEQPLSRPHSQAAAAMSTSTTAANASGCG